MDFKIKYDNINSMFLSQNLLDLSLFVGGVWKDKTEISIENGFQFACFKIFLFSFIIL